MTSIFNRIFRYRQSDGRTPKEDYFTEILADILGKHEALAAAFVRELTGRDDIRRDVDIQTQRSFSDVGRRPDIYMTAYDSTGRCHVLIIENKIDAPEGWNQLTDYMKLLEQEKQDIDSKTLVYITQHSESDFDGESNHVKFKHLQWYQVYGWIKKWMEKSDNQEASSGELVTELLNLMEDWKMDGELTANDLRAAVIYNASLHSGDSLMSIVEQALGQSDILKDLGEATGRWSTAHYYKGEKYTPAFDRFGIYIGMFYWFDRKDSVWDAEQLELPSAAVAIYQADDLKSAKMECPSGAWTEDLEHIMGAASLWMRTLDEKPCYGESLSEFYRKFFQEALEEIKGALERAKNSAA